MDNHVKIAVVEDCQEDRDRLLDSLKRYEKEHDVCFDTVYFPDGEDLVTGYTADYDIILMDIEMTFMDGMKAAQQVRTMDEDVVILFITNMPQYAIEGYKVRALDYILKPVSYFSFSESLARALQHRKPRQSRFITIALKGGRMKLQMERICYVEVQDHVLIYNTREGKFVTKGTIRDAEEQLQDGLFFRCNRCYLVNLQYVETVQGMDAVVNGDRIQISRSRRKSFLDALNLYLNGERI